MQPVRGLVSPACRLAVDKDDRKGENHQVNAEGNPMSKDPRGACDAPPEERNHKRRPTSGTDERWNREHKRHKRNDQATPFISVAPPPAFPLVLRTPSLPASRQQALVLVTLSTPVPGGGRSSVEALLRCSCEALRARHEGTRHDLTVFPDEGGGHPATENFSAWQHSSRPSLSTHTHTY